MLCAGVNGAYAVDPANVQLGSVYITPTLDAETSYVDNVRRATLDQLDYSSWLLETKPKVQAWVQSGLNTYSLSYELRDPQLESLSDAQKHLLRMGPRNVETIQAKLRAIRQALVAAPAAEAAASP